VIAGTPGVLVAKVELKSDAEVLYRFCFMSFYLFSCGDICLRAFSIIGNSASFLLVYLIEVLTFISFFCYCFCYSTSPLFSIVRKLFLFS